LLGSSLRSQGGPNYFEIAALPGHQTRAEEETHCEDHVSDCDGGLQHLAGSIAKSSGRGRWAHQALPPQTTI
jgi:hypothetical protein